MSTDGPATGLLNTLLFAVCGMGLLATLLGGMATDNCRPSPDSTCSDTLISAAYVVGWGGLAAAAVVASIGLRRARNRGTRT